MARPRNPAHRDALLAAATRVFAAEGLGASTASIARSAGVSTGTLFVYFESKTVLVNELYVELKTEMGRVATVDLDPGASPRQQLRGLWDSWADWALAAPDKRRALAQLSVADDLAEASREAVHVAYIDTAALLRRILAGGPLAEAPLAFVTALLGAIADATLDDLIASPSSERDDPRIALAFDALWRALGGAESPALEAAS